MHTLGMVEDEIVDVIHVDTAAEGRGFRLNVFAVTNQRHRIADAIEPDSRGRFGLNIGALGFPDAGHSAAQQLDGGQLTAAAHKPRETMNQRRVHQPVVDDEVFVTGQKHAAAHVLRPRVRGFAVARSNLRKLSRAKIVKRLREHVHADGAKLAIFENAEVGAEVGVLIVAVTHIFRSVEAVGLARREKVHHTATAFAGNAPAVVRALVDLF